MKSILLSLTIVVALFASAVSQANNENDSLPDGIYLGVGPTEESTLLGMGEAEMTVVGNKAKIRLATGKKIIERELDLTQHRVDFLYILILVYVEEDEHPYFLYTPYGIRTGHFDKFIYNVEKTHGENRLPRLAYGGLPVPQANDDERLLQPPLPEAPDIQLMPHGSTGIGERPQRGKKF